MSLRGARPWRSVETGGRRGNLIVEHTTSGGRIVTRQYYVYILTNKPTGVLYTGMTNDLKRRVYEHKARLVAGFAERYNADKLVYYEVWGDAYSAISREKQIKAGPRRRKIELIEAGNPEWNDLYEGL